MARRSRRSSETRSTVPATPYIKRALPYFDPMDEEQAQKMEAQVDWILENVGIAFRDDPIALEIWKEAGFTPTGEFGDLIKADAQWVRAQCAKAPSQFVQHARNPAKSVTIGGTNQVIAPI